MALYGFDPNYCPTVTAQVFEAFRKRFLHTYERRLKKSVAHCMGKVKLQDAPLSHAVKLRFLKSAIETQGTAAPRVFPAFHGTDPCNFESIFAEGLLVPGDGNDLKIAHGAAHGRGVYVGNVESKGASLSWGFCTSPRMLVCAVLMDGQLKFAGNAMVVSNSAHIVPLFEIMPAVQGYRCRGA